MTDFSLNAEVHELEDVTVGGKPVYVRELTVGDRCAIAPMLGGLTSAAKSVKDAADSDSEEDIRETAASSLSGEQYESLIQYMTEYVFRCWCKKNGERMYTKRSEFDKVNPKLVDAIYRESQAVNDVPVEEAEKNS
jgi:hypothetical protein